MRDHAPTPPSRPQEHELQKLPSHRSSSSLEGEEEGLAHRIADLEEEETMNPQNDGEGEALLQGRRQGGAPISNSTVPQNKDLNRRAVRKLDLILLPFLALLFLLNSLDKSNIGNAETAGFTHDTGLSRSDVNTSMSVFFFIFVLLQPVGAAVGRKYGMRKYVPACMSLWGLSTILHIYVRRRWHLILLRTAIATLESGFYPTTVSYMSLFYTKYEFAFRLGFFYGMTAVAGVLGGVLSWAIFSHFPGDSHGGGEGRLPPPPSVEQAGGWKSWEILFLIEGCLTMTVALVGFFWLPHSADTAWFFNAEERSWAEKRMQLDTIEVEQSKERHTENSSQVTREARQMDGAEEGLEDDAHDQLLSGTGIHASLRKTQSQMSGRAVTEDSGLSRQDILSAVFNYKIWSLLIANILSAIPATAFGVLLPILVKELSPSLNLSAAASNLLSAPPFAFGAIVLFAVTIWSDRSRMRLIPIFYGLGLLLIGLLLAVVSPVNNYWLRYFSLCVLLSGSFIASPLTVAWLANNTPEPGKRAILLGINGWGNLAGIFMGVLFTPRDEKTGYVQSFTVLLVCALISLAGFIAFRFALVRENRFRDNVIRSWSEEEKEREEMVGDIPAPDNFLGRIARQMGLVKLARNLGWEEERRGDEKMTYRYSL
ncbi:related to nicotinamide mononucleotide permease [Lecanosticta acicola]|uniref:Related to nicotinamide mononucleotide permease n=1 Tax=Lecanosticta acicola TaxID=111012 RepID=A0AAI8YXK8_9PEZI|nr:related to nicotinamide mononucleotide permease [Lecanosticta acicola]